MKRLLVFVFSTIAVFGQVASKPAEGSIEGKIVNANTGAPLKKVTVRLVGSQPQNQNVPNQNGGRGTPARVRTGETDDQGRYQFTGLEAARYTVSASRTGYLQSSYGAKVAGWGGGAPVFLSDNQKVKSIDIRLTPQGVITGRVLDEDGDPMPNVQVHVLRLQYRSGKKQWAQMNSSQTSDIGEYRIPELEPGKYLVGTTSPRPNPNVEAPVGKPETIYAATYYPRSTDETSATPIDLAPGAEMRGMDIHMIKVSAVRVRGMVAGIPAPEGGRGRGGIQVGLMPRSNGDAEVRGSAGMLRGTTKPADNTFEFRGVQPGSYVLYARSGNAQTEMFAMQPIDVGNSTISGQMLTLAPAMELEGHVLLAERDAQVDLKTVTVRMNSLMPSLGGGAPNAKINPDGMFILKGVIPLRYQVSAGGLPPGCFVQAIRYGGQELTRSGAEFASKSPIEIVISATAGKITGTVADKDNRPAMRAIVALIPDDQKWSTLQETSTDDSGAFTFDRLRPGHYKLIAWEDMEPGAYQDPEWRKPYESRGADVNIGPRDQQTVQLKMIAVDEMKAR